MKIVIHDHKAGDPDSWATVVTELAREANVDVVPFVTNVPTIATVRERCNGVDTIVFLHTEQWSEWNRAQEIEAPFLGFLAHVGTNGFSGTPSVFENRRFSSRFAPRMFRETGRGREFFGTVALGAPNWTLLNPSPTAELLTLRLLSEAWLATTGSTTPPSVPIRTPTMPTLWFAPFNLNPSVENAQKIAHDLRHLGNISTHIEKVLTLAAIGELPLLASRGAVLDLSVAFRTVH